MQIATYTKTGRPVEIINVTRGWIKIRQHDRKELSVRSTEVAEIRQAEQLPTKPAKEKKVIDINTRKNGVVDTLYLPQYVATPVTTKSGNLKRALDCGDEIAAKLRHMDLDEVYTTAADICRVAEKGLRDRFDHLNVGMQRMNLGNMIRKVLRDQAKQIG
jgi:hypothetical protein